MSLPYLSAAIGSVTQAAVRLTAYAALPSPDHYEAQITELQTALFLATSASIASETASGYSNAADPQINPPPKMC